MEAAEAPIQGVEDVVPDKQFRWTSNSHLAQLMGGSIQEKNVNVEKGCKLYI